MSKDIFRDYKEDHCWQYDMRLNTLKEDKELLGLTRDDLNKLRVEDFTFSISDKSDFEDIKKFIIKYEWLGTLPSYPTHYFTAYYKGVLAGVLIYSMPNAFSKLVGENTKNLERLLSRGACASWTPKNLASSFIMWSINWMVENTQYRVFTAYSDPLAKELGTIYQACNWRYIGQTSGSQYRYREPGKSTWVSDRKFRNVSSFKRYAREKEIEWKDTYSIGRSMNWVNMPAGLEELLREEGRYRLSLCEKVRVPPKHKYVMIKGRNRRETRELVAKFEERNPKLINLP